MISEHKQVISNDLNDMRDRIILAPLMIPGTSMPRFHNDLGEYEICYSAEYIHSKFKKTDLSKIKTSIDHNGKAINCKIPFSFIKGLNFEVQLKRILPFLSRIDIENSVREYRSLPKGTWFQVLEFETSQALQELIESGKTGLSVELSHTIIVDGIKIKIYEEYERLDTPNDKLPYSIHINGGSTWGWGPNEHGAAHLELKNYGKGKALDKIFIPYLEAWKKANSYEKIDLLISEKGRIDRKARKKLAEWLDSDNNLKRCHESWNTNNKFNENRVLFIF